MYSSFVDKFDRSRIVGWAFDSSRPNDPVEVLVIVNDKVIAKVSADQLRTEMRDSGAFGNGRHGFSYEFSPALGETEANHLSVVFARTGAPLKGGERFFAPANHSERFNPIIVTAPGRSGTTLMMNLLSKSPEVCVSGGYPFEVKMFTYYAYAYQALTAPMNERTLEPHKMDESTDHVGANWWFNFQLGMPEGADVTPLIEHFAGRTKIMYRNLFHDLLTQYYERVSRIYGLESPRYFAEKNNDMQNIPRKFIHELFAGTREIVMLRDPRDLYISRQLFLKDGAEPVERTCAAVVRLRQEKNPRQLFVKYEDMVFDRAAQIHRVSEFLDIDATPILQADVTQTFAVHGTASSPEQSVGRWRAEMTADDRAKVESSCAKFMERFDYN